MTYPVISALTQFTSSFIDLWQKETGHEPASDELYGVASPCILTTQDEEVLWLPLPFESEKTLANVARAIDIVLRDECTAFYTEQYAGDMAGSFNDLELTLIQVWSDEDFIRLQENLIGHLVTQRRLKLSPTLFIATTDSEMDMVSVCNLTGEVILEHFGTKKREVLAPSLAAFLQDLQPRIKKA
ncbi:SecY-interacting protein [Budvicia aquatica]|uniref:Protein Syd n=1 Tax=Budvicia aquatica TaxID=82979 RepID=A0A2C6DTD5_9GAMM|nr:SecY-interacting protein [Budvicia aquatica]PHI32081.1 SecY-interacting protein [Budvicia aquatica]VFS53458.1 SecY interacting protein Syd [Budvicia aquatica]